jgi:DNA-binding transcriptional regulator YiaG
MASHLLKRRGRPGAAALWLADVPYTMKLADGRRVYVEIPGRWTMRDRSGDIGFTREAMRFLDRVRALLMKTNGPPTPGYLRSLREALGLTQSELARIIGVNKLTVSRWERGKLHPSLASIRALRSLRDRSVKQGVLLAG